MNTHTARIVTISLLLGATTLAAADDWPQWRGPDRDGISSEAGWSSDGQSEPAWQTAVGLGYSSVSIDDGRLFTKGFDRETERDTIYCLDANTGKTVWTHSYPAKIWDRYHEGGTLTTPSVDGDVVYALDREGLLLCLDVTDGAVKWEKDLVETYGVTPPTWGFSASPLILDDRLIVNVGRTLALKKDTGDLIWQTRDFGHAYATPVDFEVNEVAALAVFDGSGLAVLRAEDGEELGTHEWKTQYDVNAATPVIIDGKIFISSGLNRGCALLECTDDGLAVVWENKTMRNKMSGCVLWDGHLYGFDEAILKCLDLDGNETWRERGIGNGSLMISDDRLIVISGEGELIIAEADPAAFKELARVDCVSGGVFWTMPILANGLIYCRSSEGMLVCRDHRVATSPDAE